MKSFKVPLATDETGKLVSPDEAEKGKNFFCPACSNLLILRKGSKKVAHFAHKGEGGCTGETVLHITAKKLIQQAILDWKDGGGNNPEVARICRICGSRSRQMLPEKVTAVELEKQLKSGFIADVAIIAGADVVAVIEIKATHAVDEEKQKDIGLPFIEVKAEDIINNPRKWVPIVDGFRLFCCHSCKDGFVQFQTKTAKIARRSSIELPPSYYRYSYTNCWKCGREIIVYTWPEKNYLWDDETPKVKPVPKQVKYSYSNTIERKYWANHCNYCGMIQGDFFLYSEPDGPFFGFECGGYSKSAFWEDERKLAQIKTREF